jgi:hypothetical protein
MKRAASRLTLRDKALEKRAVRQSTALPDRSLDSQLMRTR